MKKKGFTLIELLAVIVVLAIIALIATPIVMSAIEKSKKGAAERSADSYIGAVETTVATERLDGNEVQNGTYEIDGEGNLTGKGLPNNKLVIDMKGNKPTSGTITIKDGQVTNDSKMTIGDYDVKYNEDKKKYEATKSGGTNPDTPSVKTLCTKKEGVDLNNLASGNEFTCELGDNDAKTFYVLETNGDNVSLIMNANIDSNGKAITPDNIPDDKGLVAWSEDGSNHKDDDESAQAITAKAYLSSSTTNWTKLNQSQIKLPTASQIAATAGTTFDGVSMIMGLPAWIYDNMDGTANAVSGIPAYWTSTPYKSNDTNAWGGGAYSNLSNYSSASTYGIRPVITVLKSDLS